MSDALFLVMSGMATGLVLFLALHFATKAILRYAHRRYDFRDEDLFEGE